MYNAISWVVTVYCRLALRKTQSWTGSIVCARCALPTSWPTHNNSIVVVVVLLPLMRAWWPAENPATDKAPLTTADVDPVAGVHTNHIKSRWNTCKCKAKFKSHFGVQREFVLMYLDEYMWCITRQTGIDIFLDIIAAIARRPSFYLLSKIHEPHHNWPHSNMPAGRTIISRLQFRIHTYL